jgi:hypothetical protein
LAPKTKIEPFPMSATQTSPALSTATPNGSLRAVAAPASVRTGATLPSAPGANSSTWPVKTSLATTIVPPGPKATPSGSVIPVADPLIVCSSPHAPAESLAYSYTAPPLNAETSSWPVGLRAIPTGPAWEGLGRGIRAMGATLP